MSRPDRKEFLNKTTFGFIPAGTANGLIKSISDQNNENFGILEASFFVAKGTRKMMDLTELTLEYLQNEEQKKIYMFLSMAWAFVADCDINSEVIRCIGESRFTIWGVYRLLALRDYKAKVMIKGQAVKSNKETDLFSQEMYTNHYLDDNFKHLVVLNTPWIGSYMNYAPMSKLDDGTNDIVYMTMDKSRY